MHRAPARTLWRTYLIRKITRRWYTDRYRNTTQSNPAVLVLEGNGSNPCSVCAKAGLKFWSVILRGCISSGCVPSLSPHTTPLCPPPPLCCNQSQETTRAEQPAAQHSDITNLKRLSGPRIQLRSILILLISRDYQGPAASCAAFCYD